MNKETMKRHYKATPKETLIDILINSREEIEKEKEHRRKEVDYWRIQYFDLQERINKAIEYVEESYNETVEGIEGIAKFFSKRNETLLKILKGEIK